MRIQIRAIGQLKAGPEKDLLDLYRTRLTYSLDMQEIVLPKKMAHKKRNEESLKEEEGTLLLSGITGGGMDVVVSLDERGSQMTSKEFAHYLAQLEQEGCRSLFFLIGGAYGLSAPVLQRSSLLLSLGKMTWPHLLVRGLLAEQLYRAQQIRHNHPYHKE